MSKIKRYFEGVVEQAKMVRWQTRKDLVGSVLIVLAVVGVAAIALAISDGLVAELLKLLEKQNAGDASSSEQVTGAIRLISNLF